jgi:hypothetical protein
MLDLAVSAEAISEGVAVVETLHGVERKAPKWNHDADFELVAFSPSGKNCEVVRARDLARDIAMALLTLEEGAALKYGNPDWYRRLKRYAEGAFLT